MKTILQSLIISTIIFSTSLSAGAQGSNPIDQSRPEIAEVESFVGDTPLRSRTIGRQR